MGWPEQVFFFEKPTPPAPPGPFKFENSGPKIDNYQFKKQIYSIVLPYLGKRFRGFHILAGQKYFFFWKHPQAPWAALSPKINNS